jgi:RNA polymerase sigma-70 factor (ECF subfamily)
MTQPLSFDEIFAQLRQGDEAAATQVFQRFSRQLLALADHRLRGSLRQKVDAEDVVQSVFRTFFSRLSKGQFTVGGWESLGGLLTRITVRKCGKWMDYYHAEARNLDREWSPPQAGSDSDQNQSGRVGWEFLDRQPSPSEVAVLTETVQEMLRGLDEREQQIITLSIQGHAVGDIIQQTGCTQSKVYRLLRMIRERLQAL